MHRVPSCHMRSGTPAVGMSGSSAGPRPLAVAAAAPSTPAGVAGAVSLEDVRPQSGNGVAAAGPPGTAYLRPHLLKLAAYTPIEPFEVGHTARRACSASEDGTAVVMGMGVSGISTTPPC